MTTLHARLAEIEARADKATEGPWEAHERFGVTIVPRIISAYHEQRPHLARVETDGEGIYKPIQVLETQFVGLDSDAEFIASARRDVPALVAALRAVLRLHRPVDIEPSATVCSECSYQLPNGLYLGKIEEYPCASVRAAASALGVEAS